MQNTQTTAPTPKGKTDADKEKVLSFIDSQLTNDFVGTKYLYYKDKWEQVIINRKFFKGINWAAFFLGPIWMGYRKMYFYLLLFVLACLLMVAFNIPAILTFIPLGIAANVIYFLFVRNKLVGLYSEFKEPNTLKKAAKKHGGTSIFAAIVVSVILAIIIGVNFGYMTTIKKTFQEQTASIIPSFNELNESK